MVSILDKPTNRCNTQLLFLHFPTKFGLNSQNRIGNPERLQYLLLIYVWRKKKMGLCQLNGIKGGWLW